MSSSSEYNSTEALSELEEGSDQEQSSQQSLEQGSELEHELDEGSLDSVVRDNFYTCFPTLLQYKKSYLSKRNFKGPDDTLQYLNKKFHIDKIHNNLQVFPNLATDYIY